MTACIEFDGEHVPADFGFRLSGGASGWMMRGVRGLTIGTPDQHVLIVAQMPQLRAMIAQLNEFIDYPFTDMGEFGAVYDESWKNFTLPRHVQMAMGWVDGKITTQPLDDFMKSAGDGEDGK